jgi:peptidoglycan hydrolase-like protein with peptidoglycan-binding domain
VSLKQGDQGVGVSILQQNLNQLGVNSLEVDGVFGDKTFHALETFQSAHSLPITGELDQITHDFIMHALTSQLSELQMPWIMWMRSHLGEAEKTGSKATGFDNEVFGHTSYGNLDGVMEPGCAATACAALEETGFKSPHNAAAESFRGFGDPCELKPGAIVGFNWAEKKGIRCDHVSFCDHIIDDEHVACVGGNQGSSVKVSIFSKKYIDFIRWPKDQVLVRLDPDKP